MSKRIVDQYLPDNFESLEFVKDLRRKLFSGLSDAAGTKHGLMDTLGLTKKCSKKNRCNSGLCPICQRLMRKKFMRFCDRNELYKRDWTLMTVRQKRWEMEGGDLRPFAKFNGHSKPDDIIDIPELRNLIQCLRRAHKKLKTKEPLLIVASVETTFQIVANDTVTKPFHFHLMISGLSKPEIKKASKKMAKKLGPSISGMARAVDLKKVGSVKKDFLKAISYPMKQPFWKTSKANADVKHGNKQSPTRKQLSELAYNFGPLKCTAKFIFVGIQYRGGKFRLSK